VTLLVDRSLALRRDRPDVVPEVDALARALREGETVVTTGLVLQELLQGFLGARNFERVAQLHPLRLWRHSS
jgi:hypothetical protein